MECSNCGEVLESGCSISAGLRQEDRLILDWERRHKGRSCSGALRPFGKLKWQKKGTAYPYLSCAAGWPSSESRCRLSAHSTCRVLSFGDDRSCCLIFLLLMFLMQRNGCTVDSGEWSLSHSAFFDAAADIQRASMVISNNNRDRKRWQIAFPPLYLPPLCLPLAAFVPAQSPVLPHSSLLLCFHCLPEGRWPRVCWLYQQPCIVLRGGFRLSKHLPAAAFPANTQSGILPFLSLRH